MKKLFSLMFAAVFLTACESATPTATAEPEVAFSSTPTLLAGNPACSAFGFKIDSRSDFNGTYPVVMNGVQLGTVTVTTADQKYWSWSSSFGIDGVISKGGNGGNLYTYDEATAGGPVHSPVNSSGEPADISHIDFCFDLELAVAKTAATSFKRTYDWTISKTGPASFELAQNAAGSLAYTVDVVRGAGVDSEFAVAGTITISNPTPFAVTIASVSDLIDGSEQAECPTLGALPAGGTLTCTYDAQFALRPEPFTNTATVATSGTAISVLNEGNGLKVYGTSAVRGGTAQAAVAFGTEPTYEVDESVTVTDVATIGSGAPLSQVLAGPFPSTYTLSLPAPAECGAVLVSNVATYRTNDTGAEGSAMAATTVNVTCAPVEPPPVPTPLWAQTAFAYSGSASACFDVLGFERWGWSNGPLGEGTHTFELWAGAGQCDRSKGEQVGTVTLVHTGTNVTVTYQAFEGYTFRETHVYVGANRLPTFKGVETVAPGKYSSVQAHSPSVTSFTYTKSVSGPVYLVGHAVAEKW